MTTKISYDIKWMRQHNRDEIIRWFINRSMFAGAASSMSDELLYIRYKMLCANPLTDALLAELEMDRAEYILLTEM